MVLLCITGELGTGKTLALTYLAYRNYLEGKKIYANYLLYGIPFYYVRTIPQLEQMQDGFFAGDELWSWCDARAPLKKRTQIINGIILRSRKENLTIAYTAQSFSQIDMRIRNITDYIAYPLMSVDNTWTKLIILSNTGKRIAPPMYFDNEPIFAMYNTNEKIEVPEEEDIELTETFIPVVKNPAWVRYLLKKGITNTDDIIKYSERLQKEIEKRRNLAKIQQKLGFEELVRKTISDIEIKYDGYLKNSRSKENLKKSI